MFRRELSINVAECKFTLKILKISNIQFCFQTQNKQKLPLIDRFLVFYPSNFLL